MPKAVRIALKIFVWTVTSVVAVLLLAFAVLNTSLNKRIVAVIVPEFLDATVEFSKLKIGVFPELTVALDSLVVFSGNDTVATAVSIDADVETLPLLKRTIRINGISANGLCANLWKDENGKANWDIVKNSDTDTTDVSGTPFDFSIGTIHIDGAVGYTVPSYSVFARLDNIDIQEDGKQFFNTAITADINYTSEKSKTINIPLDIDGRLGYTNDSLSLSVFLDSIDARVAGIPLSLDGEVVRVDDGYDLDLSAGVDNFKFKPVLDKYLSDFSPEIIRKVTAGTLSLQTKVKGKYSETSWPAVDASLKAQILGADIRLKGKASNLTDRKPKLEAHGTIKASMDSFMRFVPDTMDVNLSGDLKLSFDKPYSSDQRFTLSTDSDSLSFQSGTALAATMKNMHNSIRVTYERNHFGLLVPKLEFKTDNRRVKLLVDGNRINLRDISLTASVRKIKIDTAAVARRRASMAELQQQRLRAKDSLPEFLSEKDFEKNDLSFSLDSSITNFLSQWSPAGAIHLGRASIVSPQFPLRLRINGMDGKFDSNRMDIDYAGVQAGRSDLAISGNLSGYRGILMGRKSMLNVNLDAYSGKLNVNELLFAIDKGANSNFVENGNVHDESFAIDTLSDSQLEEPPVPLIVIPANLRADINLDADSLKLFGLDVTPLEASIRVQKRTFQLLSSRLSTSVGELMMDAYYSTKTKRNISAGLNVDATGVSASGIINLMPSVDTLFPMLRAFDGNMNASLTATTKLDTNMNVIIPSLNAMFRIYGKNLHISDAGNLRKVNKLLLFRNPDIGDIQDMSVGGVVKDSKVEIYPFIVGVDRYKFALSGTQGFDGQMNYHASILRSPLLIRFGIDIKGTPDKWKWKLCRARYKSSYAPVYTQRIDSMQFNVAKSIRSVINDGAEGIERIVAGNVDNMGKALHAEDSLQMVLSTAEEGNISSFDEKAQERINSLREKAEQRAITRRSEVRTDKKKE